MYTIEHSVVSSTLEKAITCFHRASKRLQNPAAWHKLGGFESADFAITTDGLDAPERLIRKDDILKVNIPAAHAMNNDLYDRVKVYAAASNTVQQADESFVIVLRRARNPDPKLRNKELDEEATSTFVVRRDGNSISAAYYGRHYVPNLSQADFTDIIRMAEAHEGAFTGFPALQWELLLKGLLSDEIGGESH